LQLTSRGGRSVSPLSDKSRYLLEWLEGWKSWFKEYCGREGSVMLLPSSLPSIILFAYRVPLLCYFLWQAKFNFDFSSFAFSYPDPLASSGYENDSFGFPLWSFRMFLKLGRRVKQRGNDKQAIEKYVIWPSLPLIDLPKLTKIILFKSFQFDKTCVQYQVIALSDSPQIRSFSFLYGTVAIQNPAGA